MRTVRRCGVCNHRFFVTRPGDPTRGLFCSKECVGRSKTIQADARQKATAADLRTVLEANSVPEPNSGCWLWDGEAHDNGYGRFHLRGRRYYAHRVALSVSGIVLGDGDCALHRCDVPACVNPDHLFVGTRSDNTHDMWRKGRAAWKRRERIMP